MSKFYKTIIIGAGPAGLIAGKHLRDVLILDKKKEIGKPVQCGEGISKNALAMQEISPDDDWICCKIHKIEKRVPNGKAIGRFHKDSIGYVIDREKFEKYLAQDIKAKIKLNVKVIDLKFRGDLWEVITENGEVFKTKCIIGADGPSSVVRKKIFPENQDKMKFISTIEYLIKTKKELDTNTLKFYLNNEKYDHGYAWIFPKSKNIANVGACGRGNFSKEFKFFLEEIVKKNYGNYNILENRSGNIPIANVSRCKIYRNKVFLIGDAAGLADPVFKGGMNQAMMSGRIVAECILKNDYDSYEEKIKTMPFADAKLIEAKEILYGLDNSVVNELGKIFKGNSSFLKKIFIILAKPNLRKNFFKILRSFLIWEKKHNYLW